MWSPPKHGTIPKVGVALFYKKDSVYWQVEAIQQYGPNVISFQLVTGFGRIPVIGAYVPPTDLTQWSLSTRPWRRCVSRG
jgi:hypothetical protein